MPEARVRVADDVKVTMPPRIRSVLTLQANPYTNVVVAVPGACGEPIRAFSDRDGQVSLYVTADSAVRNTELLVRADDRDGLVETPVTIRVANRPGRGETLLPSAAAFRLSLADAERREIRSRIDPARMSADELRELGYPPRPDRRRPDLLATWQAIADLPAVPMRVESVPFNRLGGTVRRAHYELPLPAVEALRAVPNPIWAGKAIVATKGTFGYVDGFWTVPDVWSDLDGATTAAAAWVGIGGLTGGSVVQTGTDSQVQEWTTTGGGRVQAHYTYSWNEWYKDPSSQAEIPVGPGDRIYARVWIIGGQSHYFFANMTNGQSKFAVNTPTAAALSALNGTIAEWIVERPTLYNAQLPLARFDPIRFSGMNANDGNLAGLPQTPPNSPRDVIMTNAGRVLAYPDNNDGDTTVTGVRQQ